jgi:hypothetical protein
MLIHLLKERVLQLMVVDWEFSFWDLVVEVGVWSGK